MFLFFCYLRQFLISHIVLLVLVISTYDTSMAYYKETAYYSAENRFEVRASSITKVYYLTTLP